MDKKRRIRRPPSTKCGETSTIFNGSTLRIK